MSLLTRSKSLVAGLLLGVLAASQSWAGDATTGIAFTTFRNLTSIGVQANVGGDDDSSATVRLETTTHGEYALLGTAAFDSGMTMIRRVGGGGASDAASGNMFDGRILWLSPGDTVYWRAIYTDEDGGGGTSAVFTTATRTIPNCPTTGPRWYVSKSGSDGADGLTPATAVATIAVALTKMDAHASDGANGGIVVGPGIWREKIDLNFGTDADGVYRFIAGDGTDPDSTIFESALPDGQIGGTWTALSSGSADSTWYTITTMSDSIGVIVLNWDEYIHKKTNKQGIFDNEMGEASGWAVNGDTIFVKRRTGTSPASTTQHFCYSGSVQPSLVKLRKRNWIFKNLTFRFSGGAGAGSCHGIEVGATGIRPSGMVVDSCKFYGIAGRAVYLPVWAASGGGDSMIVARSTFRGLGLGGMTYQAAKSRMEENSNIVQLLGRYMDIHKNTWDNNSNCMAMAASEADSSTGSHSEISYNTIYWNSDDGVELDASHGINTVIYKNTVRKVLNAISTAPIYTGPVWILYNTCLNYGNALSGGGHKVGGSGGNGKVFIYHNTFSSKSAATGAPAVNAATTESYLTYRNNILVGSGTGSSFGMSWTNITDVTTNSFNYNCLDTSNVTRAAVVNGTNYSIGTYPATSTWQSSLGWDRNGPGRAPPALQDTANRIVRLLATSPAINAGMRINGVNTDHRGLRYTGSPDIGAVERNWPRRGSWLGRLIRGIL